MAFTGKFYQTFKEEISILYKKTKEEETVLNNEASITLISKPKTSQENYRHEQQITSKLNPAAYEKENTS